MYVDVVHLFRRRGGEVVHENGTNERKDKAYIIVREGEKKGENKKIKEIK